MALVVNEYFLPAGEEGLDGFVAVDEICFFCEEGVELIHSEELYCSFFDCCGFEFESVFFEEFE